MISEWTVTRRADTPHAAIELCRGHWPTPNEIVRLEQWPTLSFDMNSAPEAKYGCYRDVVQADFLPMGDLIFQPGGTRLHSRGSGGTQMFLRIGFRPDAFAGPDRLVPDHRDPEVQRRMMHVDPPAMLAFTRRILAELKAPDMGSAFLLDSLTLMLAADLGAFLSGQRGEVVQRTGGLAPWQLRRLADRIDDPAAPSPSITELAALLRITPRHLARAYRASTGGTLSDAVGLARQARAERMVRSGNRSMAEIAALLGFSGTSSFSTAFRRRAGCSPQQFARRLH
ncbi:helix-turn-helix domain-containing protein [Flavisphingomonas formosensis]|uniref:helix-turn-helix domain-containing protein n=1 Tax=Flavisphingomonas formosensis TaxID=861534 RepID=UPI0012F9DA3D|nr:AraC family transcriptional regulator [Sphingomonas formosensis]